jgi:hypothetical protein
VPDSDEREWTAPKLSSFETPENVWAYYSQKVGPKDLPKLRRLVDRMRELRTLREKEQLARRRRA